MAFLTEPEPERGTPQPVAPGITRIVARNPSPMTYWGTNTYLIEAALTGAGTGLIVLDPGPDDPAHVAATLAATAGRTQAILLSHTHHDHLGALPALRAATGAPVHAWHEPATIGFAPDTPLGDGGHALGWEAVYTPGHAADHLCFAGPGGLLFSADHVMGWSSSVVSPPGGNMRAYFASLNRLLARGGRLYRPGHGPPIPDPHRFTTDLLAHRQAREDAIAAALGPAPQTTHALMEALYSKVDPTLRRAAERNVVAHLGKLREEGRAAEAPTGWIAA